MSDCSLRAMQNPDMFAGWVGTNQMGCGSSCGYMMRLLVRHAHASNDRTNRAPGTDLAKSQACRTGLLCSLVQFILAWVSPLHRSLARSGRSVPGLAWSSPNCVRLS